MPYTGAPATVAADELKLIIGDVSTSSSGELLKSAECSYFIATYGSARSAAPHAARAVAAMFADQVSRAVGDLRIEAHQKFQHYTTLASSLERQSSVRAVPYGGGLSRSDKVAVAANDDRVPPAFSVGMHDHRTNPQTVTETTL